MDELNGLFCQAPDCKKPLEGRRRKWCSPACEKRTKYRKAQPPKSICKYEPCSEEFVGRGLYCSDECKTANKAHRVAEMRERRASIMADTISQANEKTLLAELSNRGFTVEKNGVKTNQHYDISLGEPAGTTYKIGIVSDTHMGSCQQQLTHLENTYTRFEEAGVEIVIHGGDLCEGDGKQHKDQIYNMFLHGQDKILNYVVAKYPKRDSITTYFITGSHDQSFYKSSGFDFGDAVAKERDDMKYLGGVTAFINPLGCPTHQDAPLIMVHHPVGGQPYQRSYRMQKIVEQLPPDKKPMIFLMGHLHSMFIMPGYRNTECYQLPCFQAQTPYLQSKGMFPTIGGIILYITLSDEGKLIKSRPEWWEYYVPINDDY